MSSTSFANSTALTQTTVAGINSKASLAPMIKRTLPSVVSIDVKAVETIEGQAINPADLFADIIPREFRDLFGQLERQPQTQNIRAQGSGVIVDAANGYVVTNNHVVYGAKQIQVTLYDNRSYSARIVGTDPDSDLAVLKLENFSNLKAISFGDSNTAEIGDFVVAIGNPYGIGLTATSGIVSALNRSASLSLYDNYIQTDASINSGNSGGALVDLDGNLIGINSAILSKTGGSVGIGFAIPSNIVKNITNQIIKGGKVSRGVVGIRGNDLNTKLVETLKLPVTEGAFISEVIPGSSAEKAGLKAGDVIVKLNSTKIVDFNQLRALIGSIPANTQVDVQFIRDGRLYNTKMSPQARDSAQINSQQQADNNKNIYVLNLFNTQFVDSADGVRVTSVERRTILGSQGIRQGDILISVNNKRVANIAELKQVVNSENSSAMILQFKRDNRIIYVTLSRQ